MPGFLAVSVLGATPSSAGALSSGSSLGRPCGVLGIKLGQRMKVSILPPVLSLPNQMTGLNPGHFCLFVWGPVLRALVVLGRGGTWDARDGAHFSHVQGKGPPSCLLSSSYLSSILQVPLVSLSFPRFFLPSEAQIGQTAFCIRISSFT